MKLAEVFENFTKGTAAHQLTIIRDDGIYRHLRVSSPDSGTYRFDIITWPGYLAITGDMGASVFSRVNDMFDFFRDDDGHLGISPDYWAEVLDANDGEVMEFSPENFERLIRDLYDEHVKEHSGDDGERPEWADELWGALNTEVLSAESVDEAHYRMDSFRWGLGARTFWFPDAHDYGRSLLEYDRHLLWRMFAIAYAIRLYDAAKAGVAA